MNTIQAKQLGDKYILLDLLGIGGMAEVFRAKQLGQQGFEKQIVIKKLLPQVAQDKEMVRLFIGEARLAAMLQHENVAATYDFGEIDGCYFLAMEYLAGVDLHTLLKKTRELGERLEMRHALMIAGKICEGMDYAHRLKDFQNKPLNIIHRDLTPHNIFVTYDGKVKILDFGVAKAEILDNKTQVGVVKGKLSYMSPEQISGEKVDARSDIFSIGILLYEMLSGQRMYEGDTAALIQKCLTVEYVRLEEIIPDLPAELYAILDKALDRDREKRYQSVAQMQADIEDLMFNIARRTDSKSMQSYIRGLFEEEYSAAQEKSTRAMDGSSRAAMPPRQDKTVVLQPENAAEAASPPDRRGQEPPRGDAGKKGSQVFLHRFLGGRAQFLADRRFLIGAGLALILLLAVLRPAIFTEDEIATSTPSTNASTPPPGGEKPLDKNQVIAELQRKAELRLAANQLLEPAEDCAVRYYDEILDLDPGNIQALEGLDKISDRFATQAELEYKENNLEAANRKIDLGLQVAPRHQRLLALKSELSNLETAERFADLAEKAIASGRIAEARDYIDRGLAESPHYEKLLALKSRNAQAIENEIGTLAAKARKRLQENKLTTPVDDSALTYFEKIGEIEPESKIVKRGYQDIADRYAALADEAYRNLQFEKCRHYVDKGLEVMPGHKRLLALKVDLSRSKPGKFFRSVKKNIGTILE